MSTRCTRVTSRLARGSAAGLGLAAALSWPRMALADDMSGLVYPFLVWPLGLVILLILLILLIIALVKLRRGTGGRTAGCWIMGSSALLLGLQGLVTAVADRAVRMCSSSLVLISLLPVALPAVVNFTLGWLLLRRRAASAHGHRTRDRPID